MDKIVSLSKRRGFVFPSSEIYGGLGSSYDYGHYGVLLKDNVKARWLEAMVRERDDIVALDSSIILHPEGLGGVRPRRRLRRPARRLPHVQAALPRRPSRRPGARGVRCGKRPSKRPGETPDCDLTEARQFNLMFQTRVGAMEESGVDVYLRPETAQGIFINFKNVAQIARRKPPFGIAQVGKSFRNEITPGQLHLPHARVRADGDGVLRAAGGGGRVVPLLGRRAARLARALRRPREPSARPAARRRRALALLERDERHRVPLPDRLVGARGDREPRRLRPDPAHERVRDEARVGRRGRPASASCPT